MSPEHGSDYRQLDSFLNTAHSMRFFSVFTEMWSSPIAANPVDAHIPMVNVDGTPMTNESIDIHGNPFGFTNAISATDADPALDSGISWS